MTGKKIPVGGIPGLDLSDPKQLADFARLAYCQFLYEINDHIFCVESSQRKKDTRRFPGLLPVPTKAAPRCSGTTLL